ncbi:MAG: DUF4446 family protein [Anaerolineae bacterium]|nr:DUF4446 family protein [Chloroflexota bacterium]
MEIALLIWSLALTLLLVVSIVWVFDLQRRLRRLESRFESVFSRGEDASLGRALKQLTDRFSRMSARTERLAVEAGRMDGLLRHAVQGMGFVRYSAFDDTGGDQSFSLALVDGEGDGVVMSALYGRDATRVYAKPVERWTSPRSLTGEEEQALTRARKIVVPDLD